MVVAMPITYANMACVGVGGATSNHRIRGGHTATTVGNLFAPTSPTTGRDRFLADDPATHEEAQALAVVQLEEERLQHLDVAVFDFVVQALPSLDVESLPNFLTVRCRRCRVPRHPQRNTHRNDGGSNARSQTRVHAYRMRPEC